MLPTSLDPKLLSKLQQAAIAVAARAYAPYSEFPVGAAVLWSDGGISLGVNVENASYPLAVCAERNAVAAGVVAGHAAAGPIVAVAISADGKGVLRPCGGCRQVLQEFCGGEADSLLVSCRHGEQWQQRSLAQLLPEAFGPENL